MNCAVGSGTKIAGGFWDQWLRQVVQQVCPMNSCITALFTCLRRPTDPQGSADDTGDAAAQPSEPAAGPKKAANFLDDLQLPKWVLRTFAALILMGQVTSRVLRGRIHWKNTLQQLKLVGPRSLGVALLTAAFVGMVFTIQVRKTK